MSNPACLEPSLYSPHLKVLLRGIKRVNASHNARIRLPITASIMHRIKGRLQAGKPPLHEYSQVLLWAACCVGYFGFLRTAEFLTPDDVPFSDTTHLSLADISLDQSSRPWKFLLHIKASKTDQFRLGTTVVLGGTNLDFCPVAALLDYLNYRGGGSRTAFPLGRWPSSSSANICPAHPDYPHSSRAPRFTLQWPQFPYWGCFHS